jgi:hypothetical protein
MVAAHKDAIRDPHEVPDKSGPSESAKMRGVMSRQTPPNISLSIEMKEVFWDGFAAAH